jgi:hypothetical protein
MSIIISPRATSTTDQKRKAGKRPANADQKVGGFVMPEIMSLDPDGSVIVTVSDEGQLLLQEGSGRAAGKDDLSQSTTAFLNARQR